MKWWICPRCGGENTDDWPLEIGGEIVDGGCQECWEDDCATSYAQMLRECPWMFDELIYPLEPDDGVEVCENQT